MSAQAEGNRRAAVGAALILGVWALTHLGALLSAGRVWWVSEIYSHCAFVVPASAFLIWRERARIGGLEPKLAPAALVLLVPVLLVGVLGVAGRIELFRHASAFAALPLLLWLVYGTAFLRQLWFPLGFVVFAVPVGDQLVPFLQRITADMAVWMLQLTGIPVFRNGLYLDIPNGRFLVAEACSGVSFLIASVAFGAFFAYVSYRDARRRAAFVALSLVLPVLANGVRVFGLIVIGHLSDMEHAVGADHLIYGWVFFAIIVLLLVSIGNRFADRDLIWTEDAPPSDGPPPTPAWPSLALAVAICVAAALWRLDVGEFRSVGAAAASASTPAAQVRGGAWQPVFSGAATSTRSLLEIDGGVVDVFVAEFPSSRDGAELVSDANRFYDPDSWTLVRTTSVTLELDGGSVAMPLREITATRGTRRLLVAWYELNGVATASATETKLRQALDVMAGGEGAGRIRILSVLVDGDRDAARARLINAARGAGQ